MSTENKALVRRAYDAFNRGDLDACVADVAPDYVYHGPGGDARGPDAMKQLLLMYRTAFPDCTVTIEEQLADGDNVITRSTIRGTHGGEFAGIPASGRAVAIPDVAISRVANGKFVEEWQFFDQLAIFQAIGTLPALSVAV